LLMKYWTNQCVLGLVAPMVAKAGSIKLDSPKTCLQKTRISDHFREISSEKINCARDCSERLFCRKHLHKLRRSDTERSTACLLRARWSILCCWELTKCIGTSAHTKVSQMLRRCCYAGLGLEVPKRIETAARSSRDSF
jgi:hypothetical protein